MRTAVFSIVSPNYRRYAQLLMESLARHHADWDRFTLVVGGDASAPDEIALDTLALLHAKQFCFRYTILELNTAVKPWMFEHLFTRGYDRVVFLDPDILVFSPLVEIEAPAFLTLTPHLTGFVPGDAHPSERAILQSGAYNLGFLAVQRDPQLTSFLDWWKSKLEFQCVVDIGRGLFVDQKWLDLAPGLFARVSILRHDGYNVAYWNLRQRRVAMHDDVATVNGAPLRFFHFSGVDPSQRRLISKFDTLRLTDAGDAATLVANYQTALRDGDLHAPYAFATFHDGTPISDAARYAYRESEELQARCGEDPFAHPECFTGMNDPPRPSRAKVNAYRVLSSARPLVKLLPRPLRTKFRTALLGAQATPPHVDDIALPPGVNIAGYLSRETGVGESARLCRASCEAAGLRTHLVDVDASLQRALYPITIQHVNADQTHAIRTLQSQVFDGSHYNIGVWHWELPEFPDEWIASAQLLDEIWAPTSFIQSAISRKVTIPVVHLPHGVKVHELESCTPQELGVPRNRFVFLCMFDLGSILARKNPFGAIEAFRRANADAALLIKVSHADKHRDDYVQLVQHVRAIPNVYLTDRMLPRARVNGLIDACDAVLSLHRSEGFGLIPAEAMVLGKPVIATAWSGNIDFMNASNSCPVNYELVTLDRDHGPYRAGQQWAEPDLDHAASFLTRLVEDRAYRNDIGERARITMREQFSFAAAGERYRQRLRAIRR